MFLIVDAHPNLKAKLVRDFVDQQEDRLKLFYLPAYFAKSNLFSPLRGRQGHRHPRVRKPRVDQIR
jgi:hypothetical protein